MQNTPTGAAHAAPQRSQRIVALDGLRALAIAGVVLYHLRPSRLTGGFLGVTLFFTLSGYLATKSIMRATARDGFSYPRYICRRVTRLTLQRPEQQVLPLARPWTHLMLRPRNG